MRIGLAIVACIVSMSERCVAEDLDASSSSEELETEELTTSTTAELPTSMDGAAEASIFGAAIMTALALAVINN
jgi:hypothetical protein